MHPSVCNYAISRSSLPGTRIEPVQELNSLNLVWLMKSSALSWFVEFHGPSKITESPLLMFRSMFVLAGLCFVLTKRAARVQTATIYSTGNMAVIFIHLCGFSGLTL